MKNAHTDDALKKSASYSGDPWIPRNAYFQQAEAAMEHSWKKLIWPLINGCDFERVVDLAAGHGRNSARLLEHAEALIITDIQPGNVEACQNRFSGDPRVTTFVGTGYDLEPVESGTVSLVYCFDAMVHFNPDVVRSYLLDTHRVLKPGGRGFFHHSNYTGGTDWKQNPGSRNHMSLEIFRDFALEAGLRIVEQKVIDWSTNVEIDCLSLVEKPA